MVVVWSNLYYQTRGYETGYANEDNKKLMCKDEH